MTVAPRQDPFARAEASARALKKATGAPGFDTAVVLGSGWLAAADAIGAPELEVPLEGLGGFEQPTTEGHAPAVRYLKSGNHRILIFLGRVHMYEGHEPHTVVHGVRTAIAAGCRTVVLTNAAGGVNPGYGVGQPVLISDHLNLTGRSPLSGPLPAGYPPRFTDLTEVYSKRLRALARAHDPALEEGIYAALPGPHYETPAEIRMLRTAGADLVGMSTVLEAIAARHLGAEVLAISLVTNPAAGLTSQPLDHREVLAAAHASAARIGELLAALLPLTLPFTHDGGCFTALARVADLPENLNRARCSMTYPASPNDAGSTRVRPDNAQFWAGGVATAIVAALIALVGILICRWTLGIPILAPAGDGAWGNAHSGEYVLGTALVALVATALLYLLVLATPSPGMFFGWIMGLVTLAAVVYPFSTNAPLDQKAATAIVNLVLGVATTSLLIGVAARAVRIARTGRPPSGPPPSGPSGPPRPPTYERTEPLDTPPSPRAPGEWRTPPSSPTPGEWR